MYITDQTIKQREPLFFNLAVTVITIRLYRVNNMILRASASVTIIK